MKRLIAVASSASVFAAAPAAAAPYFSASSTWNTPIAATAQVDASSTALVGELNRLRATFGSGINTTLNSTPIYTAAPGQATTKVVLDTSTSPALSSAFNAVPVPATALPSLGGDGNMVVNQPSTDTMWEFWHMYKAGTVWHARWGGRILSMSTNPGYFRDASVAGVWTERWFWGAPATSMPLAAGVVTAAELQSGHIDHALYMAIPQARANVVAWPAQRTDGASASPTSIPEGARFRLAPGLDLSALNLPPVTRMLAAAAQKYGIIVNNTSGSVTFRAEDPLSVGYNPYPALLKGLSVKQILAAFPWQRLQLLQMTTRAATG
jgi:hypothetical protein